MNEKSFRVSPATARYRYILVTAIGESGRKEPQMKVTTFSINTTDGKRYGLKNAKTGQVLYGATAKYKTESGAVSYAKRHGYEF